jgi:hypothetical protein
MKKENLTIARKLRKSDSLQNLVLAEEIEYNERVQLEYPSSYMPKITEKGDNITIDWHHIRYETRNIKIDDINYFVEYEFEPEIPAKMDCHPDNQAEGHPSHAVIHGIWWNGKDVYWLLMEMPVFDELIDEIIKIEEGRD